IGILERPGYAHSSSNLFVGRYAFYVFPSSAGLDINTIHNFSKGGGGVVAGGQGGLGAMTAAIGDRFSRDMGAGTYEINLGAFLTDLNTNYWPPPNGSTVWGPQYNYIPNTGATLPAANRGAGFDDAVALLRYRYGSDRDSGTISITNLFGPAGIAS